MKHTFKLLLFPGGADVGGVLAVALKEMRLLSVDFNGQWIAVSVAFGGLILGNYIDNNRESARIERELEQDRIRSEKERKITTGQSSILVPKEGARLL